jgi:hypothetical protein
VREFVQRLQGPICRLDFAAENEVLSTESFRCPH